MLDNSLDRKLMNWAVVVKHGKYTVITLVSPEPGCFQLMKFYLEEIQWDGCLTKNKEFTVANTLIVKEMLINFIEEGW